MILGKTYDKIFQALLNNNQRAKELFMEFYKKLPENIKENLRKEFVFESQTPSFDDIENDGISLATVIVDPVHGVEFLITDNSLSQDTVWFDLDNIHVEDGITFVSDDEPFDGHNIYGGFAKLSFKNNPNCNDIDFNFDIICRSDGYHLVSAYTIVGENSDESFTSEVFDTKIDLNDFIVEEWRKVQV